MQATLPWLHHRLQPARYLSHVAAGCQPYSCCNCMHAHARSADALQFLRSYAPQPAHDYSMTAFAAACAAAYLCHAARLAAHDPTSASLVFYAAILLARARIRRRRRRTAV
jgi:hypothetical protein